MSRAFLIRDGCVLTLSSRVGNLRRGDVLVEDGRIAEIGENLRARGAEEIDASHAIVMPGFVDTHRHAAESLFRNLGERVAPGGFGRHYQPEDVYAATLIGLLGAVEAGITTIVDWSDTRPADEFTDAALQAHTDSGVRTVFVRPIPAWSGSERDAGAILRRLIDNTDLVGPSTTVAFGSSDAVPEHLDGIAGDWGLARELGLRIHAHAGTDGSHRGIVSALGERNLLGPDVTLVHCTKLAGSDLDAVASAGAGVSLAPSSEMASGLGPPPIQELIDRGIRPGFGVDKEQLAPGDMFAQMRAAISVQHATRFDLKLAGKAGLPRLMTTRDVIQHATIDGAGAIGLEGSTGSLAPGLRADLIVLRTDRPNIFPVNDPIGAVVWGMDTSNLDWVFVDGRPLLRNGELEADVSAARDMATAAHHRVAASAGLTAGTTIGGGQ